MCGLYPNDSPAHAPEHELVQLMIPVVKLRAWLNVKI